MTTTHGRLNIADKAYFLRTPINLIKLFQVSLKTKLLIRSRVKANFGYNDEDNNLASLKAIMSPSDPFVDFNSEKTPRDLDKGHNPLIVLYL